MDEERVHPVLRKLSDAGETVADASEDIRGRKVLDRNGEELGRVDELLARTFRSLARNQEAVRRRRDHDSFPAARDHDSLEHAAADDRSRDDGDAMRARCGAVGSVHDALDGQARCARCCLKIPIIKKGGRLEAVACKGLLVRARCLGRSRSD